MTCTDCRRDLPLTQFVRVRWDGGPWERKRVCRHCSLIRVFTPKKHGAMRLGKAYQDIEWMEDDGL